MATQYATRPRQARFFLSVGRDEPAPLGDNLIENRLMRDVLQTRGYQLKYEEIEGEHDWINWRLTLPDGLMFLDPKRP